MPNKNHDKIPLVNKRVAIIGIIIFSVGIFLIFATYSKNSSTEDHGGAVVFSENNLNFTYTIENKKTTISVPKQDLLFDFQITFDKDKNPEYVYVYQKKELFDFYKQVGFPKPSNNTAFVYPLFTQAAYGTHGFYDYYSQMCGQECLTVPIPSKIAPTYATGLTVATVLSLLNYTQITDMDIDRDPSILKKYDKIIILHNEYVTKKEFDAITNHPHAVFLYPNALYAEVQSDYNNNKITLVKGHSYPDSINSNGFDWKYDNTNLEYNIECKNMTFTKIPNGSMLNCYPAYKALYDKEFLKSIKMS